MRPATPPLSIPAHHQFLSEDESSSDSDAEATHALGARLAQQNPSQMPPGQPPVLSASSEPQPQRSQSAAPSGPPDSNGSAAAAAVNAPTCYYMPVVDKPSLLDMVTSIPGGSVPNGTVLPPSLLDMDWALPGAGMAAQKQHIAPADQARPSQQVHHRQDSCAF